MPLATVKASLRSSPGRFHVIAMACVWVLLLLLLFRLEDNSPDSAQTAYEHASTLFQHGDVAKSQLEAELGVRRFSAGAPAWSSKFLLLEAESMLFRGMDADALHLLDHYPDSPENANGTIEKLAIEGIALTRQAQFALGDQRLIQAEVLCQTAYYPACGDVLRARGIVAAKREDLPAAQRFFIQTIAFARAHGDSLLEGSAASNLGFVALQVSHFDEAIDWSEIAFRQGTQLGAEDLVQVASGNLGWAYYQLGDGERALAQFLEAERSAARIGNVRNELQWISTAGYVYRDTGDLTRAAQSYRQALYLARQIGSKEDIVNALEDLAQLSVLTGDDQQASAYVDQVIPLERSNRNRLSPTLLLTQGKLAAARHQDQQAGSIFRQVQNDPSAPTTTRLDAGYELAALFESQGNIRSAEQMYKSTLTTFESARAQIKKEDSVLPFVANATRIYDDYIRLLVKEGRIDEALAAADQSRARTLAQGLGFTAAGSAFRPTALNPRQIAQKANATLLFYWLGEKQSYLWAITPAKITLFPLPAQKEIVPRIQRYSKALLDMQDTMEVADDDGQALYKLLVAPASTLIRPNAPIMILADGPLSQLNFETLLVPGSSPGTASSQPTHSTHYWIDDATLVSAPSLATLAAASPGSDTARNLLLLGNPVSPSDDFPSLPLFGFEMTQIERHFSPRNVSAFTGQQANPATYLSSDPAKYSYIHFVSHAVASRIKPLDSAIILSNSAGEDSFKLYARDIMRHPIKAQLVTISACYGSGTRSYSGEGLVGLSWAFLRAGAHNTIGALWEVSDDSTPRLMDSLYQGLEEGQSPAAALRRAKLTLLHSNTKFRNPFYWAPFQIYTRL